MRCVVVVLLLGLVAVATAQDRSRPAPITGVNKCLLPITKLRCYRDWRSGFMAGLKYGYGNATFFSSTGVPSVPTSANTPLAGGVTTENWFQVCSPGIFNQTNWDMSIASQITNAQNSAPAWYGTAAGLNSFYDYPSGAPITQVIVLKAPNPYGDHYGNIPAVIFVYIDNSGNLDYAVCGNAVYANFYLNPSTGPAPPTPVSLMASYTSGLSDDGVLTALGSIEGKCGVRGTQFNAYHGGDPWALSHFRVKALKKPCFTKWDTKIYTTASFDARVSRTPSTFACNATNPACTQPCAFDKKNNKHGPTASCVANGINVATGKFSVLRFSPATTRIFEFKAVGDGHLQMAPADTSAAIEGEVPDADEEQKP